MVEHTMDNCPFKTDIVLLKDHQRRMDKKLDTILEKLDKLDKKFAGKRVEKVLIWAWSFIWLLLLGALLRLILIKW